MRELLQVLGLVMVLAIFGTVTASAQNDAAEAIEAVNQLFQEYVAAGNADGLAMLYTGPSEQSSSSSNLPTLEKISHCCTFVLFRDYPTPDKSKRMHSDLRQRVTCQ